ncbi:hypothetical protein Tsubulata_010310 [Turnera subulata]|uniref:LSM-interacting domain-containing protein n=1 Tax=Turnera subulata TaxID=218843 RepID=A0A9Q0JMC2_9ROSI|nr:hypothetical protein Tsubulata_010310 [Turnera subulata]
MEDDQTLTPAVDDSEPPPPAAAEMMSKNDVNEAEAPLSSSASASSSPSSEEEESQQQDEEDLKSLESELSTNPSNYDAHLQYIKVLRKMGEIEKLRKAREAMNAVFPLSPQMWMDWAHDEASLSDSSDDLASVHLLYERAVSEYLSVPLWCSYLNYVQEHDPSVRQCSPDGISKARALFEQALVAAGLHLSQGPSIWDSYRDFELALLLSIPPDDLKAKELQVQRVRTLFKRQLSIPLLNLSSVLQAYKAWEAEQGNLLASDSTDPDGIPSDVAAAYRKAVEMSNARAQHEQLVSSQDISDAEKFQNFMNYIKFEKSVGDPTRVQLLYERAVTELPVSSDIWLDYTRYMNRTLKVGNIVTSVHSRAVKNCPWVGELWVRYLLCLERGRASEDEISAVFEKSLQCTFSTVEEYLDIFLTRVDGLRRRISAGGDTKAALDYSIIRETFQYASDYLSPQLKDTESLLHLHAYWSRLEVTLGKDLVAARGVWESLLKTSGSMLKAWLDYIAMEIELGHINEARAIYRRCYSKRFPGAGSEEICHSWLRFEREFGTLEDFDHAMQKVTPRLEELQLYRLQQESAAVAELTDQREVPIKKTSREKRKANSNIAEEQSQLKRQKQTAQTFKKGEKDAEVQNLAEANEPEDTSTTTGNTDGTHDRLTKSIDTGKRKVFTDQCTAFISNLSLQATTITENLFVDFVKGLAYVDFSDEKHLTAAVAKNRKMLLGKKLSIARSDPKKGKKDVRQGLKQDGNTSDPSGAGGDSASKGSVESTKENEPSQFPRSAARRLGDNIQLRGKNTFAVPRNVRPLGWAADKPKPAEGGDDNPKSNEEFRKMFIKG